MTDVTTPPDRQQPAHYEWPRCDRCGARGKWVVYKGDLSLTFCGHHGEQARVVHVLNVGGWETYRLV